jgi:hypothetical protein
VNKADKPEKYEAILGNVYDFLYCMCGAEKGADISTLDLKKGGESYLELGGLNKDEIARIEEYVSVGK